MAFSVEIKFVPAANLKTVLEAVGEPEKQKAALRTKQIAERMAAPHIWTGDYRRAFVTARYSPHDWTVGNTDWKANILEKGGGRAPPLAILRRATMAAGYRLTRTSR